MFLKKSLKFLFCFYKDYWEYKLKIYKNENISLDFLDMSVSEDNFKETTFSVFLSFNSVKYYNTLYPINYQFFIISYFLKDKKSKSILTFDTTDDTNYHCDLQHFQDPAQIKNSCMYSFYDEKKLNDNSNLSQELTNFSTNFFEVLFKKLEIIGSKIEYKGNISISNKNYNRNRFKIDIYICNSSIKEFPFWGFLIKFLNNKLRINYNRGDEVFSKLSFKYENCYITFINYNNNYNYLTTDRSFIYQSIYDYSLNYETYMKDEFRFLYNYVDNWFSIVSFFKKNFKFIKKNENYLKKILLEEFSSIKSYAWFIFNKYLIDNDYFFRNKFTIGEYDVFSSSLFFGIQTIENYNDLDLITIYENFDKINHWDDFDIYLKNTLEMYEYDINGAFSHAASLSKFSNEGYFSTIKDLNELTDKSGFCFVIIEDTNPNTHYHIPVRDLVSKQVHYNCFGKFYGWYNIDEILQLKNYCTITPLYVYYFENPKYILSDFVYSLKDVEYKNRENKNFIKIMLNSVFGMFGYKDKTTSVNLSEDNKNVLKDRIYKKINLKTPQKEELILTLSEKESTSKSKYFFINSIINSQNRIKLREFIFEVKRKNGIIGSINIDSFWTDIALNIKESQKMGDLKIKNFKKKILFINKNSFINFTDKIMQYNNKKINDMSEIKKVLLKLKDKKTIKHKVSVDFIDAFYNLSSLKSYISKGTFKFYDKLNDNLKSLIKLNESFSSFQLLLEFINNNQPEQFKDALKNKLNKYAIFNYKISLFLLVEGEIIKQLHHTVTLNTKSNTDQMNKLYEKFDTILYYWFENYADNMYTIEMGLSYEFGNEELIKTSFTLKSDH